VATVESGEGRRLAESLVKQLSGGDRIKARLMRKDFFDFWPTHKLWLATNHKPNIKGTDHGIWRRIRLIPFIELITDDEKDPMLPAKLKAELPGIMARAVRGCREWLIDGLNPPEAVTKATADYRAENDMLAAFIEECCVQSTNATAWAGELYTSYKAWCEQTGERYETQKSFGQRLKERGFECVRSTGNRVKYYGIGLIKLDECEKDDGEKPHTGEGATSTTWEDFQ
jgi:putative DNA primase/helicase